MSTSIERDPSVAQRYLRRSSGAWPSHWPLTVVLAGFPLWWILGLASFLPVLIAVPMAWQLIRSRRIAMPGGFGWWLLFLVWMAAGLFLLFADAPGAVPGGGGGGRVLVFGLRASWYLACTVVLLWVANSDRTQLSVRRYCQLFGYMFVLTTLGGLIGMTWPEISLTSPLEMVLPGALANNGFVSSLVHLDVADIQTVLGDPEPRPTMPFAYANTWGSAISLFLPFFLVAWFRFGRTWQRVLAPFVLAAAALPIVYSLNRGLWFSLAVGAVLLVVLQLRTGRPTVIVATAVVGVIAVVAILASPLSSMVQERFEHQHSNERRSQLLVATVESTALGSPLVGFGSTRDVQGSFASIAGGSTPDCPACGVPPLGTQGQLWMVIFSQGFVGLVLFLAFFLTAFGRVWRCRSLTDTLCFFVLVFFGMQLFVYDTLDMPMYTVMATIGLAWRERQHRLGDTTAGLGNHTLEQVLRRVRRGAPAILAATLVGGVLGLLTTVSLPTSYDAKADVLLAPTPRYLATTGQSNTDNITIDTEAALVFSQETLERLPAASHPQGYDELRDRIQVTAPPNTSILTISVRGASPEQARTTVQSLVAAYLDSRSDYLEQRRQQVLGSLQRDLEQLDATVAARRAANDPAVRSSARTTAMVARQQELQAAVGRVTLVGTEAGELVRVYPAQQVRTQAEVPIVSGAMVGFLVLAVVSVIAPNAARLSRRSERRGAAGVLRPG